MALPVDSSCRPVCKPANLPTLAVREAPSLLGEARPPEGASLPLRSRRGGGHPFSCCPVRLLLLREPRSLMLGPVTETEGEESSIVPPIRHFGIGRKSASVVPGNRYSNHCEAFVTKGRLSGFRVMTGTAPRGRLRLPCRTLASPRGRFGGGRRIRRRCRRVAGGTRPVTR